MKDLIEIPVGEIRFINSGIGGRIIKCVAAEEWMEPREWCRKCFFYDYFEDVCPKMACTALVRKDKTDTYFIEVHKKDLEE